MDGGTLGHKIATHLGILSEVRLTQEIFRKYLASSCPYKRMESTGIKANIIFARDWDSNSFNLFWRSWELWLL